MKLRTVIVEDEQPSLQRMKDLLAGFGEIELVGTAQDGQEAVELIDRLEPDLAFLDIQLPVFTSFEVLDRIRHRPQVIFVTAYDEYAIRAFEENAIDYLMKPTTHDKINRAIARIRENQLVLDANLISSLKHALQPKRFCERYSVRVGDEILFIPSDEVYWFHAADKYIFLHTFDKEYILDTSLKRLEKELDPDVFVRIHKSTIVSIKMVNRIKRGITGNFKIQLNDARKTSFEIGRTYLPVVKDKLDF